jgi:hypothetical protein
VPSPVLTMKETGYRVMQFCCDSALCWYLRSTSDLSCATSCLKAKATSTCGSLEDMIMLTTHQG